MELKTTISGITLENPIMAASGTFGFGYEYQRFYDINILGTFSTKGITLEKRFGNSTPRIAECKSGLLNSIGLQNPGVHDVVDQEFKKLKQVYKKQVIANVGGSTIDDYVKTCKILDKEDIVSIIELNVSCPNVKTGGIMFGTDKNMLKELILEVKKHISKPLYVKLSPNVSDIVQMAKVSQEAGADGLVLINTLVGMRIDIKTSKPIIANKIGGFSGPAIFPVALRMVYEVYKNVDIPIIGVGGITNAKEVIEMMQAGASAVQIGSQNLVDPYACKHIIENLEKELKLLKYTNIKDIIGAAHE